ncbi:MAG: hypothetical protein ACXVPN_13635 [Bacteroidia bacterium]
MKKYDSPTKEKIFPNLPINSEADKLKGIAMQMTPPVKKETNDLMSFFAIIQHLKY